MSWSWQKKYERAQHSSYFLKSVQSQRGKYTHQYQSTHNQQHHAPQISPVTHAPVGIEDWREVVIGDQEYLGEAFGRAQARPNVDSGLQNPWCEGSWLSSDQHICSENTSPQTNQPGVQGAVYLAR
ncbi:hypothetical protein O181_078980 [Austropuccinia psidii MF-1]|uniref:Uncharacterized protein n=1 Tax=Austropuccinia psidii MF-1 TaxID=1389203 RepID=A0A9Q3FDW3_9BASI|nr:hypothetical protein [Austropuccinia psidii MF-1]